MDKRLKRTYITLSILVFISIVGFMSVWLYSYKDLIGNDLFSPHLRSALLKVTKRRTTQMIAIIISVILISVSSLSFQTITNNRILTPSILGFDSIYVITQTMLVFLFGSASFLVFHQLTNFVISVALMILIIFIMFILVMRKNKNNIVLLLLFGLVITSLSGSISNFIQVFMHPEEFQSVVSITNVNIHNINESLVFYLLPVMLVLLVLFYRLNRSYDVMALGEHTAINLGLDYHKKVNYSLVLITISIAISTALIGPLAFLGLIVVNASKELTKSHTHTTLFITSSLLSVVVMLLGQVILELTKLKTPVTVVINLVGGAYMIYMLLKENVKW